MLVVITVLYPICGSHSEDTATDASVDGVPTHACISHNGVLLHSCCDDNHIAIRMSMGFYLLTKSGELGLGIP